MKNILDLDVLAVKWRRDVDLRPMSKADSIGLGDLTYRLNIGE